MSLYYFRDFDRLRNHLRTSHGMTTNLDKALSVASKYDRGLAKFFRKFGIFLIAESAL